MLSLEPLLGPIDMGADPYLLNNSWVIAGAESGHRARDCEEWWVRSIKNQCVDAGIPFFYKQAAVKGKKISTPELDGKRWIEIPQ